MIRSTTLAALAIATLAAPARAAAQDSTALASPKSLCFNGARQSECSTFVIAEMQGSVPLPQTTSEVGSGVGPTREEGLFGERLQWELGLMHNVSERWAVGGAARLGSGSTSAVTALSARAPLDVGRRRRGPVRGQELRRSAVPVRQKGRLHRGRTDQPPRRRVRRPALRPGCSRPVE